MAFKISKFWLSRESAKKFKPLFDEMKASGLDEEGKYKAGLICDVSSEAFGVGGFCTAAVIPIEDYQRLKDLMLEIVKKYKKI